MGDAVRAVYFHLHASPSPLLLPFLNFDSVHLQLRLLGSLVGHSEQRRDLLQGLKPCPAASCKRSRRRMSYAQYLFIEERKIRRAGSWKRLTRVKPGQELSRTKQACRLEASPPFFDQPFNLLVFYLESSPYFDEPRVDTYSLHQQAG